MSGYSDDSMLAAQKKMMALQRKILAKKKRESETKPVPQATPAQDISIFESLDKLENDIELSKKELDEYLVRHGNTTTRPIPNLHQISPLSRRILSELKKVIFSDVPESQLRELTSIVRKIHSMWFENGPASFRTSIDALNRKGNGGVPRPIDNPYRRLYATATNDLYNLVEYMDSKLANVKGHNYFKGSGIPKRFL